MKCGDRIVFKTKGQKIVGQYKRKYNEKYIVATTKRLYKIKKTQILGKEFDLLRKKEHCEFLVSENERLKTVLNALSKKYPEVKEMLGDKPQEKPLVRFHWTERKI